ncbi:dehydratase [Gordonia sp. CPCC 206044]|uniref:dehydratase n=1 Tax=Gordonia sp. CPCC 206044 TaxID=3140793 RepID=UPI003AF3E0D3
MTDRQACGTRIDSIGDLEPLVGSVLGCSSWLTVERQRIAKFADAAENPAVADVGLRSAQSAEAFGQSYAPGGLILSLIVPTLREILAIRSLTMGVNYGLDKVRFIALVPAGSRIRLLATLLDVEYVSPRGVQVVIDASFECQGGVRPVATAEAVYRYFE